jgi:hypothetical protein
MNRLIHLLYSPSQKTLMLLDDKFPDRVLIKDLATATNVPGFVQAHDNIKSILTHWLVLTKLRYVL